MQSTLFAEERKPSGESVNEINGEILERAAKVFPGRAFVFGMGNQRARVMVVGESPGPQDIATGEPFTGPAGDLLKRILASIGLRYNDCWLTNVVKFVSQGDEITNEVVAFFTPYLFREIEAVNPEIVIAIGSTPTKALIKTK